MTITKKSWQEKLNNIKYLLKVIKIKKVQEKKWGKGTMAIPSPQEVDKIIRSIPKGKLMTLNQIRERVAKKHKATIGCPITTGIFSWIAAYAAEEMRAEGKKNITPWWRVLKGEGFLNEKFPGATDLQKKLLQKEGHKIVPHGSRLFVEDLIESLVTK